MTTVYDLRGTHGSGKSYIVHFLLKNFGNKWIKESSELIGHYCYGLKCAMVGPYNKICGGCDAIKTQDEVERRVKLFTSYPKVLLEGSLVGHTFERYAKLAKELIDKGVGYKFLFLNTPYSICLDRVMARRIKAGNDHGMLPDNVKRDHNTTQVKLPRRFSEAGFEVITIDWESPVADVLKAMGELE